MVHDEDILETALNQGIAYASNKYLVTKEKVIRVVNDFKIDIDDKKKCMCELHPHTMMCFICTRPKERINI